MSTFQDGSKNFKKHRRNITQPINGIQELGYYVASPSKKVETLLGSARTEAETPLENEEEGIFIKKCLSPKHSKRFQTQNETELYGYGKSASINKALPSL